jgi:hypothetical protein
MRDTFLVAFGAGGLGAAAGALAVFALHTPAPVQTETPIDERALAAAFERALTKGVADLRRDLAGVRDALAASRGAAPAEAADAPPGRRRAPAEDAAGETRSAVRRTGGAVEDAQRESPFDAPNPPANFKRLRALANWDGDAATRKTWLFADEATCLSWFGAPDEVAPNGEAEVWYYNEAKPDADGDGEPDGYKQYCLQFSRGRVFRIDIPSRDE